jgi:hypothetical protein
MRASRVPELAAHAVMRATAATYAIRIRRQPSLVVIARPQ